MDGGWSTLPDASTIACGITQYTECNNPTPSCGGSYCSGVAQSVNGTQCGYGNVCYNGNCTSCTSLVFGYAGAMSTYSDTATDWCNDYSVAKEVHYYYKDSSGTATDFTETTSDDVRSTIHSQKSHGSLYHTSTAENYNDSCPSVPNTQKCPADTQQYTYDRIYSEYQNYSYTYKKYCYSYCGYKYKITPTKVTSTTPILRQNTAPHIDKTTTPHKNYLLTKTYDGATVSFTCTPNECGYSGDSPQTKTVVVGINSRSDNTDGCSSGTNDNIYTAPAHEYDKDIKWTCKGTWGGSTNETTDDPYKCTAGTVCEVDTVYSVGISCRKDVESGKLCSDIDSSKSYCNTNRTACVVCAEDSHCFPGKICSSSNRCVNCPIPDDSEISWVSFCDNTHEHTGAGKGPGHTHTGTDAVHTQGWYTCNGDKKWVHRSCTPCTSHSDCGANEYCTSCHTSGNQNGCKGAGSCQSCTWKGWYCPKNKNDRARRNCRAWYCSSSSNKEDCDAGGTVRRYEIKYCPSGQTCSSGQCS